ncbi:hypothetical protein [Dawidia soli]|uniref:Uncharacterized protein n=1 Tax=Dawidia soli TaxID=2782352 RepID=A0AAP2GIE2_9BACT|nr:hypothetical protein [Dawidia soli]MBT1687335.1 hypothetical protein [Dawidia soli]
MQKLLFVILLVVLNILAFLLLNVSPVYEVNRKKVWLVALPVIVGIIVLIMLNGERYIEPLYITAGLISLMALKFLIHKIFVLPRKNENQSLQALVQKAFDTVLFPVFILFFSILEAIFVWQGY